MSQPRVLSRRTVLRGVGAALALPWLEAMAPARAWAAASAPGADLPLRMAFLYVPNGIHMASWTPKAEGKDFELPETLAPLAPFKDDLLVLTGLAQDGAFAHGDGGGDHARSLASFLTGTHPRKTDGADIHAGVSVDQVAAQKVGSRTRFPSLELGIERGAQSGNCDSGYSCAYSSNISWRSPTTPNAKEINPRLVFERLFARPDADGSDARRARYRRSILDLVAEDANHLRNRLGRTDRGKIDEYLTSVRELEVRIARAGQEHPDDRAGRPAFPTPTGIPKDHREHIRLMCDLMTLAFQTDSTRIITFMFANEGSNRNYPFIEVPEGHHDLSHHGGDAKKHAKLRKINRFHVELFAGFLARLKGIREGDGTLLDRCMIVFGSGISDGDRHNHDDLPILLAGTGGGTIHPGRHVKYKNGTPLNNLYLSMLDRIGAPVEKLGDSKGRLDRLTV